MKTKGKSSSTSKKRQQGGKGETTPLGESILQGLKEGFAIMHGEIVEGSRIRTIRFPDDVEPGLVRKMTGLSQAQFAKRFGFSLRTLQDWEQGRAKPDIAVKSYLTVIARNPAAVEKALQKAS